MRVGSLCLLTVAVLGPQLSLWGQDIRPDSPAATFILKPAQVFDGEALHQNWAVRVSGDRIEAAGPALTVERGAKVVDLPGLTLMPGLVEGHSHVFLHAYKEASWNDQVAHE